MGFTVLSRRPPLHYGDLKGPKGRRAQTQPWIATRLAGNLLDPRSERRVRGDQAARW
jgi:hypothetical protein